VASSTTTTKTTLRTLQSRGKSIIH
jgi:hypothetical protein